MGPSLTTEERTRGLILGICAYGAWGLMPLYFSMVRDVPPIEMLFQRVIWSFFFLIVLLIALGKFSAFSSLWMKPRLV
ncbi:MAG: EamA family transporter, partial [Planctomycetes bacterium]|nr:EamA family transporter [Planctomycetota bacterium]